MRLNEFIDANMGNSVRIGFNAGFVYCDICSKDTVKELEDCEKRYLKSIERKKDKAIAMRNIYEKWSVKSEQETRKRNRKPPRTDKELKRLKKENASKLNASEKEIERYKNIINNWPGILNIEATDIYTSSVDGALIFIGKDNPMQGPYTDRNDYINRFNKITETNKKQEALDRYEYKQCMTVDANLRFLATPMAEQCCGKINPEFLIKELLDAKLYLLD